MPAGSVTIPDPPGATAAPALLTAEEFCSRFENQRFELVQGVVQETPMPNYQHGYICSEIAGYLREFVKTNDLGRIFTNDSFIRVQSNPDTVRGADVCFISYTRLPRGKIAPGLLDAVPELVVEVRSPSDTWTAMMTKVLEYLAAGVQAVVVVHPEKEAIAVYRANAEEVHFTAEQELMLPDLLPGFSLPVKRLFE